MTCANNVSVGYQVSGHPSVPRGLSL